MICVADCTNPKPSERAALEEARVFLESAGEPADGAVLFPKQLLGDHFARLDEVAQAPPETDKDAALLDRLGIKSRFDEVRAEEQTQGSSRAI